MATLSVTQLALNGSVNYAPLPASANGDQFANTGSEYLWIKNADASPKTVTIQSVGACNFGLSGNAAGHAISVNAVNGTERIVGPFDPARFSDSNGNVQIVYSAVTNTTVAVFRPANK